MDPQYTRHVSHPKDVRASEASTRAQNSCDNLVMVLYDIEPGDPRLDHDVLPVLCDLRPHLTSATLAAVYEVG